MAQTYTQWECIVVDDHSTDRSVKIVKEFVDRYPEKIKLFINPRKGACAARNVGFEHCRGEYIQYLDADDLMDSTKIYSQIKVFEKLGDDIVVSGQWDRFYSNIEGAKFPKRFLDKNWESSIDWLVNSWEGKGMATVHSWLVPRKLVEEAGSWDERLKVNQDGEFFCRILLNSNRIKFCNEAKVYYRTSKRDSVSKVFSKEKAASLLLSFRLCKIYILKFEDSLRVRKAISRKISDFLYRFYSQYPDLSNEAMKEIKELGFAKPDIVGGENFKKIASILGFENTLKLRKFFLKD